MPRWLYDRTEIPDDHREFFEKLGEIIVRWNDLEASLQILLYIHLPSGRRSDCVIGVMGTAAVLAAIKAITEVEKAAGDRLHVARYCELIERAQQYRNHYVHGPRLLGLSSNGLVGLAQNSKVTNGNLFLKSADISIEELDLFLEHLPQLRRYSDVLFEQAIPDHMIDKKRSLKEFESLEMLPPLSIRKTRFSELGDA